MARPGTDAVRPFSLGSRGASACRGCLRATLDGADLFFRHVRLLGGPAPVRRYLPQLIDLVFAGKINPGKVFDLVLPLDQVAEGYRAMDERRAIKTLLRP